jgi:hypothetical protein
MRNPVSGEIKELSQEEFLKLFDKEVHARIVANSLKPGVDAVVCLENLQMDSSHFGDRSALIVGPECTFQLKHLEGPFRLGELPSTFKYPTAIWKIDK